MTDDLPILPGNAKQETFFLARHAGASCRIPELWRETEFESLKAYISEREGARLTPREIDSINQQAARLNARGYSDLAIWIGLGL